MLDAMYGPQHEVKRGCSSMYQGLEAASLILIKTLRSVSALSSAINSAMAYHNPEEPDIILLCRDEERVPAVSCLLMLT
jgi:hypothetical protein